ncbi:MAG: 5,6-dimethylbenzimidazole synthase [Vulcanimicrobiaceae bacterium]
MTPERPPVFDRAFRDDLERLFTWRRDVRRFTAQPLPSGELEALVALAALAPSVGYSQPARFVRVGDATRRAAVIADFDRCNASAAQHYAGERGLTYATLKLAGLREAPVHLAAFVETATPRGAGLGRASMPEMLAYSAVLAVHTFWLAARARGIGVGWVSILDPLAIAHVLDVPQSWSLVAYLCVGYPQEEHCDRELARAGWEGSDPDASALIER